MKPFPNAFAALARQADHGDVNARSKLYRTLEPEVVRMVRRVVCHGAGTSALDRRILAEARRVGLDALAAQGEQGDRLLRLVAHSVCVLVLGNAKPTWAERIQRNSIEDTVRG